MNLWSNPEKGKKKNSEGVKVEEKEEEGGIEEVKEGRRESGKKEKKAKKIPV